MPGEGNTTMTTERFEVTREIAAPPATVFALLCDPRGHVAIDSSGMLQSAHGEDVYKRQSDWFRHHRHSCPHPPTDATATHGAEGEDPTTGVIATD